MVGRALAAVGLVWCAWSSATAAVAAAATARELSGGPVLAGSGVAWAEPSGDGFIVHYQPRAGDPRRVGVKRGEPGLRFRARLAGSPTHLAVAANAGTTGRDPSGTYWASRAVLAGPVNGPLQELGRCVLGGFDLPRPVDISGSLVAFGNCHEQRLDLRDLATGGSSSLGARDNGTRVAGRFVAWIEAAEATYTGSRGDVVVYDTAAGSEVYRLPRAAFGAVHNIDLQDDGKLAVSFFAGDGTAQMRVGWASPAEPALHVLPLPASDSYDVRIANNLLAYQTGKLVDGKGVTPATIGVTDLAGRATVHVRGAEDTITTEGFDFDGKLLAWYSYGCTRAAIRTKRIDQPPVTTRPPTGCKLRFRQPPRANRRGRVPLRLDCYGFANHVCLARRVRMYAGGALVASGRNEQHVTLTPAGRALRSQRRLSVTVIATLFDLAGRRDRRRGTTTLMLRRARG
jgi:hypothetical protein